MMTRCIFYEIFRQQLAHEAGHHPSAGSRSGFRTESFRNAPDQFNVGLRPATNRVGVRATFAEPEVPPHGGGMLQ